jgi:hypothetical protein
MGGGDDEGRRWAVVYVVVMVVWVAIQRPKRGRRFEPKTELLGLSFGCAVIL